METLKKRLLDEDAFVRKLVDTIPPKLYFNQEVKEHLQEEKHAYISAGLKVFGTRAKKINVKGKQKRARLDPILHKTVSEIQENAGKQNSQKNSKTHKRKESTNMLVLHDKLTRKIEMLKANRLGPSRTLPKVVKPKTKDSKKNRKTNKPITDHKKVQFQVSQNVEKCGSAKAPIVNKEGKIVYSKFDFVDFNEVVSEKKPSTKNKFKRVLDKLEREKERMQELSSQDPQKAENLAKKLKWKTALDKAEGVKVKDNPDMLKKAMKRREFKKKKSQKQWANRAEQVKKGMDQRQFKRNKNIRAKKQQKIDKKIKVARKKGRSVNGF